MLLYFRIYERNSAAKEKFDIEIRMTPECVIVQKTKQNRNEQRQELIVTNMHKFYKFSKYL